MIVFFLIFSVLLGVLLGIFFGNNENLAKRLLVLSAGFLITVCVVEVFPQIYHSGNENVGLWVIAGVVLQIFLESMTKGFEHGHFHYKKCNILPIGLLVGMFVHAFIEGIPLADVRGLDSPYFLGILVHNLPISFVLGVFLFREKKNKQTAWATILFFALASPLGMFLGRYFNADWQIYFLALSGGIFLHISSVIIFENNNKSHEIDWKKMFLVILGIGIALAGHLFHEHHHH